MKNSTIALITTGVVATIGVGSLLYFDYKRRNDPNFRKQLKRERKNAAKALKEAEKQAEESRLKMIEHVIIESSNVDYPTSPEAKEKYFMEQVAAGEALCGKGPSYYESAVMPFYKALKVYPAPTELVQIYQRTIPEPVFALITQILDIEQKATAGQLNETPEAAAAAATGI